MDEISEDELDKKIELIEKRQNNTSDKKIVKERVAPGEYIMHNMTSEDVMRELGTHGSVRTVEA